MTDNKRSWACCAKCLGLGFYHKFPLYLHQIQRNEKQIYTKRDSKVIHYLENILLSSLQYIA